MTTGEIATRLKVSPQTVGRWINSDKLKATKRRRQKILGYEIEESDFNTYLEFLNKKKNL